MSDHTTPRENLSALLFDLDGTLVHSSPDLAAAANFILGPLGRRELPVDEVSLFIGDGVPKLVERAFEATGDLPEADALAKYTADFIEYYEPRSADLSELFDGVLEALDALKAQGYKMAVCTNKPYGASMSILKTLGIADKFDVVIGGDTLPGIKKPDPRHLHAAIEHMGVKPLNTLMIGDNGNDVAASHGAGLPVILLTHGYTKIPYSELNGDKTIDHFKDLVAAVESFK